ncbi:OPT oligopeptide transporter protein-domain-containing protein [Catenaria anguillulae PL171]|uniref:OPT oligopeptide transporter protein-domain-containing protein n=1 Tax=Catenaria anguillulae PL171 TaxID=765915 RepID=A0A1Y2HCS0_9FUNG|nr:OPT oligopeptide transporter protein-domain-containing protein [Catenaria anguillulae PL171]
MTEKDIKTGADDASSTATKNESFVIDAEFEGMVGQLVPTTDNVDTPALTFRVWVLGTFFCCAVAFANQILFLFRTNPIAISSFVTVLLSYPLGRIMAATLPGYKFNLFGIEVNLNPGPFSVKEHVLINVFGSTGSSSIYAFYNLGAQEVFFDLKLGTGWDLLFIFASATMGFGLAGICRRFLIRPSNMIWPAVLPSVALFTAFHKTATKGNASDGHKHMSQIKFFGIAAVAMTLWQTLGPGYLSKMLVNLPLLCWIAPKDNLVLQRLGSPKWGVGIMSLSLDWGVIGSTPMAIPFWASVNNFVSWALFAWLLVPLAWQGNWFKQGPWPAETGLNATHLFDGKGIRFQAREAVDPKTRTLNESLFLKRVSPIHFTPLFASAYFGHISSLVASIVHTTLFFGPDIARRFKNAKYDKDDIHCKLIDKYPEVPESWFYGFFIVTGRAHHRCRPMGRYRLAHLGHVPRHRACHCRYRSHRCHLCHSGCTLGLNVVSQFVIGLIIPGRPIFMMAFKCVCFAVSWQCRDLLIDLKIGHYMKVPPRHIFIAQLTSQFIAGFVAYGAYRFWMADPIHTEWIQKLGRVQGIGADWGSANLHTYYSAALIWGAIGAKRFFFDTQYAPVIWLGALCGLLLPIVLWIGHKYVGGQWWVLAHPAILLSPNGPGPTTSGYLPTFIVAFIFQFVAYRYRQAWWARYNYVLATAFDVGVSLVALVTGISQIEGPEWYVSSR